MTQPSDSTDPTTVNYSFVTKKENRSKIELLKTRATTKNEIDSEEDKIKFKVIKGSLTANNKFYLAFGDKPPFNFFNCYPVDAERSCLVSPSANDENVGTSYAHPCVWGIAQVTESRLENVEVGTKFIAMLPIGETVSFKNAWLDSEDDNKLIVDRPNTNPAYNVFTKLNDLGDGNDERYEDIALACMPGISTGFGLNYNLRKNDFYSADVIVLTSASSKVALALALYLRYNGKDDDQPKVMKKIVGYTSESNREFCRKTGLYDEVLGYDDSLSSSSANEKKRYVIIDIAGRGIVYSKALLEPNVEIVKLLTIGNASGTPDKDSTFALFPMKAKIKMLLTMLNVLPWFASWLNPVEELYLIFMDLEDMKSELGIEKLQATMKEYERVFCKAATGYGKEWISIRTCDSENSIQTAFQDILQGSVPPSETIILDVIKAVAHRK